METKVIPIPEKLKGDEWLHKVLSFKLKQLELSEEAWISEHASGTLRKNKKIGFSYRTQYLEERTAYQFGWEFRILPRSKITFGDPITESNCSSVTEAGWHIERYISTRLFYEDYFEAKYIYASDSEEIKEGIGIIIRETTAQWIPHGHIIYAIVTEFDKTTGKFKPAVNPF